MHKNQHYFFFAILSIVAVLTTLVFLPYIATLVLALVFSVLFRPLHRFVARVVAKGNETSSFATCITLAIVFIAVLIPLSFLVLRISLEAQEVYVYLTHEGNRVQMIESLNGIANRISYKVFGESALISFDSFDIATYIRSGLEWSFTNLDSVFSSLASITFKAFILFIALFYMLKDGAKVRQILTKLSPLNDAYDNKIFDKLERAINSVIRGSLVVASIQGLLTGIGFFLFGIPNPVLWGSLAAIAALIPGVGTSLVIVPGLIYLFATGSTLLGVGLLVWGAVAVGLVDNFLGPRIVQQGVDVHEFLILLSVVGGLSFFGPIGLILGPLSLSLLLALLDIYKQVTTE